MIAVVVMAASVHDNVFGSALLDEVAAEAPGVEKALADQGFKSSAVTHGTKVGIDVEVLERNPADVGFVPQPKRWRVEQTNQILMLQRRLVRGNEHLPSSSASRACWAVSAVMTRRLTGASTPARRA